MILLRILGGLFLAFGAIGLFVPLWPTTIFWILAALCFARSSPHMRDWIYARPGIGGVIEGLIERGELARPAKLAALGGMSLGLVLLILLLRDAPFWLGVSCAGLGLAMIWVSLRRAPGTAA